MYILFKFNTFSRSWKTILKFNPFNTGWEPCPRDGSTTSDVVELHSLQLRLSLQLWLVAARRLSWLGLLCFLAQVVCVHEEYNSVLSTPTEADFIGQFGRYQYISKTQIYRPSLSLVMTIMQWLTTSSTHASTVHRLQGPTDTPL